MNTIPGRPPHFPISSTSLIPTQPSDPGPGVRLIIVLHSNTRSEWKVSYNDASAPGALACHSTSRVLCRLCKGLTAGRQHNQAAHLIVFPTRPHPVTEQAKEEAKQGRRHNYCGTGGDWGQSPLARDPWGSCNLAAQWGCTSCKSPTCCLTLTPCLSPGRLGIPLRQHCNKGTAPWPRHSTFVHLTLPLSYSCRLVFSFPKPNRTPVPPCPV